MDKYLFYYEDKSETLNGIDKNGNKIRDDIEKWVVREEIKEPEREIILTWAREQYDIFAQDDMFDLTV